MKEGKGINLKSIYITYRHWQQYDNSKRESGVGVGGGGQRGSEMEIERDFAWGNGHKVQCADFYWAVHLKTVWFCESVSCK